MRSRLFAAKNLEGFPLMVHGTPEIAGLAIDPHERFVEAPTPL
jgi:hypothetical protein